MDNKTLNRAALREALKNEVPFSWYQREGSATNTDAMREAIASNRKFSFLN